MSLQKQFFSNLSNKDFEQYDNDELTDIFLLLAKEMDDAEYRFFKLLAEWEQKARNELVFLFQRSGGQDDRQDPSFRDE